MGDSRNLGAQLPPLLRRRHPYQTADKQLAQGGGSDENKIYPLPAIARAVGRVLRRERNPALGDLPEERFYRRPCARARLSVTAAVICGFGNDSKGAYETAETLADSLQRRN